jgi:hypothetical protein
MATPIQVLSSLSAFHCPTIEAEKLRYLLRILCGEKWLCDWDLTNKTQRKVYWGR